MHKIKRIPSNNAARKKIMGETNMVRQNMREAAAKIKAVMSGDSKKLENDNG